MGRRIMHGVNGGAHLRVGEGVEPADAAAEAFGEVETQGLDEHHGGEVLGDEDAARLRIAEFVHHLPQRPTHGGLVRFLADMDDGRQYAEENVGMLAGEGEVAADAETCSAAVDCGNGSVEGLVEELAEIGWGQSEVAGEAEGPAAGEKEAVSGVDVDGVGNAINDEPALAGDEGVDLDAFMLLEADGPVATHIPAAGHVAAGFQE